MKHFIVYSHGFGVRKDDRELFTDIAAAIPEAEHVLFDYNHVDETNNELTVSPLQEQAEMLKEKLASLDDGSEKIIDIVAHSQGCVVVALAKPKNVRRILCLAPPDNVDADRLIAPIAGREGTVVNFDEVSRMARRDGSTTVIPPSYWQSLLGMNVIQHYNQLADLAEVKFYIADNDEILGTSNFDEANSRIELIRLAGDHNFSENARPELIRAIQKALN